MEKILLLLHSEPDGTLAKSALEAANAALTLRANAQGSSVLAGLIGEDVGEGARLIAGCGITRIMTIASPDLKDPRYATDAAAVEAICRASGATIIIAPGTSRWSRVLPGVSHRLSGRADTHVTGIEATPAGISATRWYYRQRMEAVLQRTQRPWFLLVDPGSHAPLQTSPGEAPVEPIAFSPGSEMKRTTFIGLKVPPSDAQTIRPDAALLFVAGAGWTKKQADGQAHSEDAEKLISTFLHASRASLGSTKSLVDLGGEGQAILSFLTHFNQVGQTGSTPRHPKGLATCCHGEEPHTVGWRFISERRAVNLDPACGWARGKADVLYVADAFAVMKKVNELLTAT